MVVISDSVISQSLQSVHIYDLGTSTVYFLAKLDFHLNDVADPFPSRIFKLLSSVAVLIPIESLSILQKG
jgi:hypothetical protein